MLVNGYWAFSNRQMFYGISNSKEYATEQTDPDHGLWPHHPDHSLAVLIVLGFLLIY
jgi:hypothetical protein